MLSVFKEQVPETGHMTEEVANIADSLNELNLVSIYVALNKMLK